ncbi:hypothetical protein JL720_3927 [Aureococcus anophagefferens]|nr:hypothetical protein JL720_3927 [Aureococcus anophagefferens]
MGRAVLALLALCGAADGALRGAVAPRDADEQRAKSRRALEEVIEVVPAAEAAALAEQQAAAAAMAKAEAMMAAAKAAQAKAEADELEARAGATTTRGRSSMTTARPRDAAPRRRASLDVFTDAMFAELRARLEATGFEGLDAVAEIWEADYKHRKIVSGFLKDAALGAKRLVSMPDRVTNTISAGGATRTRPTVINCYRGGDLGDVASWWAAWQKFMFDEVVAVGDASKSPAAMLPPIKKSKYPAITEAEEAISRPLSAVLLAAFDAILVHALAGAQAATGADWQHIRGAMCDALNDRKYDRTASILETTYADADVVFLQESSAAFADFAKNRPLGDAYEFLAPGDADPKRDQNSLVLLKRGAWAGATDVTADVVAVLADATGGKAPVAPGDLAAVAATRGGDAYLLVSFHGDTNGLATKPVLDAAHAYRSARAPGAKLLFGLDANVYAEAVEGKAFVGDFAAQFSGLGMASSYGTADAPAWSSTTFNARTFLQPQLNKAVKREDRFDSPSVDRNPKDFILFYAADFSLLSASKDNTGDGAFAADDMFPTLAFPSDHAVTKVALAAAP